MMPPFSRGFWGLSSIHAKPAGLYRMSCLSDSNFSFPKEISIWVPTGCTCHLRGSQTRFYQLNAVTWGQWLCEHEDTLYTTVACWQGIGWPLCGFCLCGFLKDFLQIETSRYAQPQPPGCRVRGQIRDWAAFVTSWDVG